MIYRKTLCHVYLTPKSPRGDFVKSQEFSSPPWGVGGLLKEKLFKYPPHKRKERYKEKHC